MRARRTRQLDAVSAALMATPDHPTAAQLHARVTHALPRISLGTVYRNLEKLIRAGEVVAVRLGDEVTRYDGMVEPHDHFVCRRCGSVADLTDTEKPEIDIRGLARAGYAVDSHRLAVFGLCRRCAPRRGAIPRQRKGLSRRRL